MTIANLCAPGVSVRATRYAERQATPEQWATGIGAQVAINADFFDFPGWSYVLVRARGAGEEWPAAAQRLEQPSDYWQFGRGFAGHQVNSLVAPADPPRVTEIVGAYDPLIVNGAIVDFTGQPFMLSNYRRSAIGMSADRRHLYFYASTFVINGPNMAAEMISMAAEAGAPALDLATNMDGGGSSQLYVQGLGQIITSGRQVNTHLGVYASGTGASPNCNDVPPPLSILWAKAPPRSRRHVTGPEAYAAWKFDAYQDLQKVSDAVLAEQKTGPAFPAGPRLIRPEGKPHIYLLDGAYRRHVPNEAVAAAWRLDLATAQVLPAAEVERIPEGYALPDRPWLIQGTGPAIYVVDDQAYEAPVGKWSGEASTLAPRAAATLPSVGASSPDDRTVLGGCSQVGQGPVHALILALVLRRRRRRGS